MRRLDSCSRVLDHQAFFGQDRIALAEHKADSPERCDKAVGLRLSVLHVFSRDDIEKQLADFRAAENRLRFDPQRAGRDHQRKSARAVANELLRARIENVALGKHLLVDHALARSKFRDKRLVRVFSMLTQNRRETIVIVESNQPRIILVARNLDLLRLQSLVKGHKMQRLSIGQGSIKIEYDSANHLPAEIIGPPRVSRQSPADAAPR